MLRAANIKTKSIMITLFVISKSTVFPLFPHISLCLLYTFIIYTIYMYLSKKFSDHAVAIFPQPDRLHIRFQSDAV
jgi:hypothetical protein